MLSTCWQIVEFQDDNKLLEQLVTTTCNKSVELNNHVAGCQQAVDNLVVNKLGKSIANTSWCSDYKLLEQHRYKSAAGLLQLVRFYVCIKLREKLIGLF
jgi:hypothetical protein